MNPVIGLDVAKGESQGQAFLDKGKPHGKSIRILHTRDGLDAFHLFLQEIEALAKQQPTVILKSTGHYHAPIVQFLEQHHYAYIMVNPLISHQAKKSSLRKVKTDAVDAYCLAELFYKEEFDTHKKRGLQLLNLRNLTRQHAAISGLFVQTKLQFLAILDQVFPEYRGVFGDLYSHVSLEILQAFPTSTQVLALDEEVLADKISSLCKSRSPRWARERAQRIREAALRNPFTHTRFESHLFSLDMYIRMILEYKEHLSALEKQIDALAQGIEEYQMIQSIPGIGGKIAATILSEIGEIDRFHHPKNWLPLRAWIRASTRPANLPLRSTTSPSEDPADCATPCTWRFYAGSEAQGARSSERITTRKETKAKHSKWRSPLASISLCTGFTPS